MGISDTDYSTFRSPLWPGLKVSYVRAVVPYDIADPSTPEGRSANNHSRANFRRWLAGMGPTVQPMVVFQRSATRGHASIPPPPQLQAEFRRFRQMFPRVTVFGAWNEPSNAEELPDDAPRAAQFWLAESAECPGCTVVAGEFTDNLARVNPAYVDAYQAALGPARPTVWGFHDYSDPKNNITLGQHCTPSREVCVVRDILGKLGGPWANSQVWMTEAGSPRVLGPPGPPRRVFSPDQQASTAAYILRLSTIDPTRLTRVYYYDFQNQCRRYPPLNKSCAQTDDGLLSPDTHFEQPVRVKRGKRTITTTRPPEGQMRPAYNVSRDRDCYWTDPKRRTPPAPCR